MGQCHFSPDAVTLQMFSARNKTAVLHITSEQTAWQRSGDNEEAEEEELDGIRLQ